MKIIHNEKPKLKKIKMKCDIPIHEKLDKYELFRFLNKANTTLFIGLQGQGKTSLLINFLKQKELYYKCFAHIYIFMRETSRNSLEDNIFEGIDESQIFEELNYENLSKVYEMVKENALNEEFSLILYDDVQSAMREKEVVKLLKNMVANQRHLRLVNIILLQNYYALHDSIRKIINNVFLFKTDKRQIEQLSRDLFEIKQDKLDEIFDIVFDAKYNFLFYNKETRRIFKNWDEIII